MGMLKKTAQYLEESDLSGTKQHIITTLQKQGLPCSLSTMNRWIREGIYSEYSEGSRVFEVQRDYVFCFLFPNWCIN